MTTVVRPNVARELGRLKDFQRDTVEHVFEKMYGRTPPARRFLVVSPAGRVLPCHLAHTLPGLAFESVKDRPLAAIWHDSAAFNAFRGDEWMPEPCRS